MTPVAVVGACGRMGRMIVATIVERGDVRLVGAVESRDYRDVGEDVGPVVGMKVLGVRVVGSLEQVVGACRVVIDYSSSAGVADAAALVEKAGVGYVCGVTGLSDEAVEAIDRASKKVPVVRTANSSTSVNVLLALARGAARALGPSFDVEIVETHHNAKADAPSGTALALADVVLAERGWNRGALRHGREGAVGARPKSEIGVHAVRAGDVVGEHTVIFAGPGERIELTSRISTRRAFAEGAVRAALWLDGRGPGVYTMAQVLGLGGA